MHAPSWLQLLLVWDGEGQALPRGLVAWTNHFQQGTRSPSQGPVGVRLPPWTRLRGCNELSVLAFPADTPIEEFTPTPAFPALQYLESVDEGGVAWQAGLRTGDFLIEVGARVFISFCRGERRLSDAWGPWSGPRGHWARGWCLRGWHGHVLICRYPPWNFVSCRHVCVWVVFEAVAVTLWRVEVRVELGHWSCCGRERSVPALMSAPRMELQASSLGPSDWTPRGPVGQSGSWLWLA